jgi:tellurium resistance protein TerD
MSIVLTKGGSISLEKEAPGITLVKVGLGWNVNAGAGAAFDLDASAALLDANGKLVDDKNFVYFHNLKDPSGAVQHSGDNLTGAGDGDDEVITVDLSKVPANVDRIRFAITLYDAAARRQTFGIVEKAYARVLDAGNGDKELARVDLTEDQGTNTTYIPGELYRHDGGWKFKALDSGLVGSIADLVDSYR